MTEHKPYVSPTEAPAELSLRAVVLGALFGVLFGAVTVYLALKVGLTVSASIPIAVLAIVVFRRLGRSTILENNIVQTIGSAGESIAAGVVFTLPALIFLNSPLEYHRIFLIALGGGVLGVLLMIPLRRALIVREHDTLRYPEGTACANILIAGEKGGSLAGRVFAGVGVGALYKALAAVAMLWKETPVFISKTMRGLTLSVEGSPELLGVGYIIGFRASAILVSGGLLSWMVLIPFIKFFGQGLAAPLFPGKVPIAQMDAWAIWSNYVRYIGAGAVAAGGVINLVRALPTIIASFRDSIRSLRAGGGGAGELRTERDLPITLVLAGSLVLVVGLWVLINFDINPGHPLQNAVAALLIILYGFFFVTVSSRVVGMIGSSNNPISGDTITTLMGTCLLFVLIGWTGHAYAAVALSIGAVVCIAAANAGATSQDLKTGFLVGATPRSQQIGLVVGVFVSVLVIGLTLKAMNSAYHTVEPVQATAGFVAPKDARRAEPVEHKGARYEVVYLNDLQESAGLADGKYLVNKDGQVAFRYVDGIGGRTLAAPQARLMALVIDGILNQKLPWTLVLLGIFIGIVMELCGVHALPFAVGVYLPLSTTMPVFFGGVCKLVADKLWGKKKAPAKNAHGDAAHPEPESEDEASEGMLFSSGLIAGGALMGIGVATLILGSGRSAPLANALEVLRGDSVTFAQSANFTVADKAAPEKIPVRSRWFESQEGEDGQKRRELVPAVELNGTWQRFDQPLDVRAVDDRAGVEYEAEARRRALTVEEVPRWLVPIVAPPGELSWIAKHGAAVAYNEIVAKVTLADGKVVEIRVPQNGRLQIKTPPGAQSGQEVGALELSQPAISVGKTPPPVMLRRIVVEALPSSDALALLAFLSLCGVLVWFARRGRS